MDFLFRDQHLIYQFFKVVTTSSEKKGVKLLLPLVRRCETFAELMQMTVMCDHVGVVDGQMSLRIQFCIKAPQYIVLTKVAMLFQFAASEELLFTNQFYFSK